MQRCTNLFWRFDILVYILFFNKHILNVCKIFIFVFKKSLQSQQKHLLQIRLISPKKFKLKTLLIAIGVYLLLIYNLFEVGSLRLSVDKKKGGCWGWWDIWRMTRSEMKMMRRRSSDAVLSSWTPQCAPVWPDKRQEAARNWTFPSLSSSSSSSSSSLLSVFVSFRLSVQLRRPAPPWPPPRSPPPLPSSAGEAPQLIPSSATSIQAEML